MSLPVRTLGTTSSCTSNAQETYMCGSVHVGGFALHLAGVAAVLQTVGLTHWVLLGHKDTGTGAVGVTLCGSVAVVSAAKDVLQYEHVFVEDTAAVSCPPNSGHWVGTHGPAVTAAELGPAILTCTLEGLSKPAVRSASARVGVSPSSTKLFASSA